jgi:hypothetical protein
VESIGPTVLWRLFRPGGRHARAVMLPGGPPHTVTFFVNDEMDRVENYDTMDLAVFRSDEIRRGLADDGWLDDDESLKPRVQSQEPES